MPDEQTAEPDLDVPVDREPAQKRPAPVPVSQTPFGKEFRRRHMPDHLRPSDTDPTIQVSY